MLYPYTSMMKTMEKTLQIFAPVFIPFPRGVKNIQQLNVLHGDVTETIGRKSVVGMARLIPFPWKGAGKQTMLGENRQHLTQLVRQTFIFPSATLQFSKGPVTTLQQHGILMFPMCADLPTFFQIHCGTAQNKKNCLFAGAGTKFFFWASKHVLKKCYHNINKNSPA